MNISIKKSENISVDLAKIISLNHIVARCSGKWSGEQEFRE